MKDDGRASAENASGFTWTYQPVDPDLFGQARSKILMVGVEPRGGKPHPPSKNMGEWLRLAPQKSYWENKRFYLGLLMRLRAVLEMPVDRLDRAEEDLSVLNHLHYVDLKATEGWGRITDPPTEIIDYVKANIEDIKVHWVSYMPEITVLLGWRSKGCLRESSAPSS